MRWLRGLLEGMLSVAGAVGLVVLGNIVTAWLLLTPPNAPDPGPRAWTWDPFHNYVRRA